MYVCVCVCVCVRACVCGRYFKACSATVDVRSAAVFAATLAAGGASPWSKKQRFERRSVSSAVQLMFSCGMCEYDTE